MPDGEQSFLGFSTEVGILVTVYLQILSYPLIPTPGGTETQANRSMGLPRSWPLTCDQALDDLREQQRPGLKPHLEENLIKDETPVKQSFLNLPI